MTSLTTEDPIYTKAESWKMFNRIASRYDFLNRFLSLGLDVLWRRKIADFLPEKPNLEILDLATGTADVPLYLLKGKPDIKMVCGIDMAEKMLKIGRKKIEKRNLENKIYLKKGDANQIPFEEAQFDCVTIAFGIRNVAQPFVVLNEMLRVLKKGGRALILEFSLPCNKWIRPAYLLYLKNIVPFLGGFISFDYQAYRYLNKTVEAFPYGEEFCRIMKNIGFDGVVANRLCFGVATIYQGDKP